MRPLKDQDLMKEFLARLSKKENLGSLLKSSPLKVRKRQRILLFRGMMTLHPIRRKIWKQDPHISTYSMKIWRNLNKFRMEATY